MSQPFPAGDYWYIRQGKRLIQFATWLDAWEFYNTNA